MPTPTLVSKHFADSKSNEKRQTSADTPLPLLLAMKGNTDSSRKRPTKRASSNFVFATDRARRINSGSACGTCRRRKTKCNGARPCAFCSSNQVECLDSKGGITKSPIKKNHPTLFKRDVSVHSRRRNSSMSSTSTSTTLSIDNWNDKHHRNQGLMSIASLLSPIDTTTTRIHHDKRVVEHIPPLVTGLVDSYTKENEFQQKMIPEQDISGSNRLINYGAFRPIHRQSSTETTYTIQDEPSSYSLTSIPTLTDQLSKCTFIDYYHHSQSPITACAAVQRQNSTNT